MFVSSLNVRYRDVQHLIGLALLVWFWLTPIVYPIGRSTTTYDVEEPTRDDRLVRLPREPDDVDRERVPEGAVPSVRPFGGRPLAPFTAAQLGVALSIGALILLGFVYLAWRLYFSMSGDFAEEL